MDSGSAAFHGVIYMVFMDSHGWGLFRMRILRVMDNCQDWFPAFAGMTVRDAGNGGAGLNLHGWLWISMDYVLRCGYWIKSSMTGRACPLDCGSSLE